MAALQYFTSVTEKIILFLQKLFKKVVTDFLLKAGLPHTQGIQGNSGNFQVEENLRETKGDSGNLKEF